MVSDAIFDSHRHRAINLPVFGDPFASEALTKNDDTTIGQSMSLCRVFILWTAALLLLGDNHKSKRSGAKVTAELRANLGRLRPVLGQWVNLPCWHIECQDLAFALSFMSSGLQRPSWQENSASGARFLTS